MAMKHSVLTAVFVACICFISYENSLSNDFAFDDHLAIVNNADTDPLKPYSHILQNDIWGKNIKAIDSHRSFRPLLILVFKAIRLGYGLNPRAFRIVSITVHGVVSQLVYHLAYYITSSLDVAIGSALLFASHPVHVESVSAVVNIAESLSCFMYLTAYFIFLRARERTPKSWLIFPWIIATFASILFKESALSICGVLYAEICASAIRNYFRKNAVEDESSNEEQLNHANTNQIKYRWKEWLSCNIPWILAPLVVLVMYAVMRYCIIHGDLIQLLASLRKGDWSAMSLSGSYLNESLLIRRAENPFAFLKGKEKVLSIMYLHFRYFFVLVWPKDLCPEYAFNCIPSVENITDSRFIFTLILYIVILSLGVFSIVIIPYSRFRVGFPSDSLVRVLIWMIIPFIPAAAIFIRLGTLLAERLLYIPSIGFCMLASMGIFLFSSLLGYFTTDSKIDKVANTKRLYRIQSLVYWSIITAIVSIYIIRTRQYNPNWKDDPTLFQSALKTCPNSAKLNLQVAKLRLNEQNFTSAEYYIRRAKEIDPKFCDVGYQEALLNLFYYHNQTATIQSAIDNLSCIYSSKQSLELITKLWEQQILASPTNYQILITQGNEAVRGKLFTLGAKKYISALNLAFENHKYSDALMISTTLGGLIPRLENDTYEDISQRALVDNLICDIELTIGKLMYNLQERKDKKSLYLPKNSIKALSQGYDTLRRISSAKCVSIDPVSLKIIGTPALEAINIISPKMLSEFNPYNISSIETLAKFSEDSAGVLFAIDAHRSDMKTPVYTLDANEWNAKAVELALTSLKLWFSAGKLLFNESLYIEASARFKQAMKFYFDSDDINSNMCAGPMIKKGISNIGDRSVVSWCMDAIALHSSTASPILQQLPYPLLLYWYVHSIAGKPDFLDTESDVKDVVDTLRLILVQDALNPALKTKSESQLSSLLKFQETETGK